MAPKEPYKWDYTIKIRTKEGTFVYEKELLENIDSLLKLYPEHEEVSATRNKQLVKRVEKERKKKND